MQQLQHALGDTPATGLLDVSDASFLSWFNQLGAPAEHPNNGALVVVLLVAAISLLLYTPERIGFISPHLQVELEKIEPQAEDLRWPVICNRMLEMVGRFAGYMVPHSKQSKALSPLILAKFDTILEQIMPFCSFDRVAERTCSKAGHPVWQTDRTTFMGFTYCCDLDLQQALDRWMVIVI